MKHDDRTACLEHVPIACTVITEMPNPKGNAIQVRVHSAGLVVSPHAAGLMRGTNLRGKIPEEGAPQKLDYVEASVGAAERLISSD